MRMRYLVLFVCFGLSQIALGQFSLMPHNIGVSYVGEMFRHPGGKLSLMYNIDHWNKVNKSKRGLAKTRINDITLNVNFGGFYHQRYQTALFFLPEIEYSQSNRKGWYWATGIGLGYMRTIIPNTYELQNDGTVTEVNAGHNYGITNLYVTIGKDLFVQKQGRFRFFVKPQFALAFPNYPTATGYFLFELGTAYKLRYFK